LYQIRTKPSRQRSNPDDKYFIRMC
jgi:hypothetical protein